MKQKIIDYYAIIILFLFIIYNIILKNLIITGLLYQIFMILFIIINAIILIVLRKKIKYKSLVIIIYSLIWLFSKNTLQCLFDFSNIILLCATGFIESNSIKVISLLITILLFIFLLPLTFTFILTFSTNFNEEKTRNDIYSEMHYYCDNNYEAYAYSAGAMDGFHYSIGKYYEIINIDKIIHIFYHERNEKTQSEYQQFIENYNCKLVGE